MNRLAIVGLLMICGEARADWPCADATRSRIVRSTRGDKPIALATATDHPIYGELTFVELNNDGHQDLIFRSACIRRPTDSVRLHRVYAACGPAGSAEELVVIFEEEELCSRSAAIATAATQTKAHGVLWQDLQLTRGAPDRPCDQAVQRLQFDGARYQLGPRSSPASCRAGRSR